MEKGRGEREGEGVGGGGRLRRLQIATVRGSWGGGLGKTEGGGRVPAVEEDTVTSRNTFIDAERGVHMVSVSMCVCLHCVCLHVCLSVCCGGGYRACVSVSKCVCLHVCLPVTKCVCLSISLSHCMCPREILPKKKKETLQVMPLF